MIFKAGLRGEGYQGPTILFIHHMGGKRRRQTLLRDAQRKGESHQVQDATQDINVRT